MRPDEARARLLQELDGRVAPTVLAAFASVDRRCFVPDRLRSLAWDDRALPIGRGQTISQPSLVARMAALVDPRPADRALDVGTGSGYAAAVMAQLCASVVSVERHASLSRRAGRNLACAGVTNVRLVVADGSHGFPEAAPYDVISVAATARQVPEALVEQLAGGGRLLLPIGDGIQRLVLLRRDGDRLHRSEHGDVRFVPFVAAE